MAELSTKQIISAPIMGWNMRDNPVQMEAGYALSMENAISTAGRVEMRKGYRHIVDTSDVNPDKKPIPTIVTYVNGDDRQLLYCCNTGFEGCAVWYRIMTDSQGTAISIPIPPPQYAPDPDHPDNLVDYIFQGSYWGSFQFRNALYLWSLDGKDKAVIYDGIGLSLLDLYPRGLSVGSIDTKNAQNFCSYHQRIYFSERNTPYVWFVYAVEERDGECDYFDTSVTLKEGGSINSLFAWSRAGNDDSQVLLCAGSSEGEIITYTGNSPADEDWQMVNMVQTPEIMLNRNSCVYKNDVHVLTRAGIYPMTSIVGSAVVDKEMALSDVIRGACIEWGAYINLDYWQINYFSSLNWIVINVPRARGAYEQYVCNMENLTWSKFTGIPAICFVQCGNSVVFSTVDGRICEFMAGATDGDDTSIRFYVQTGYNGFESSNNKRFRHASLRLMSAYKRNLKLTSFVDGKQMETSTSVMIGQDPKHDIGTWGDRTKAPDTGGSLWNTAYWGQPRGISVQDWQNVDFGITADAGISLSLGLAVDGYEAKNSVFAWFDSTVRVEIGTH